MSFQELRARAVAAQRHLAFAACLSLGLVGAAVAHDYKLGGLVIDHPSSRPVATTAVPGVIFFTVKNQGAEADRLIAAASPIAGRVEIHQSSMADGVMKMRQIDGVDLPAQQSTELQGPYHLMLMELKQPLAVGDKFPATLTFQKAGKIDVEIQVDPRKPESQQHHHH